MYLRRPGLKDVERIEEIASRYSFPLPEKWKEGAIVEDNKGEIIAFGLIRPILEAIMIAEGRPRKILESTLGLINQAKIDAHNLGYDEIYAYVKDNPTFERLLKKRGFEEIEGKFLLLRLGE